MDCKAFLAQAEARIRPGTRGAPARREKYKFLCEKHDEFQAHLRMGWRRHWNDKHPNHVALVMQRHGCTSTDTYFLARAVAETAQLRDLAIARKKYAAFLASMSAEERYDYYVKNIMGDKYYQTAGLCEVWDTEHKCHYPRAEAGYFSELYRARRENRVADDGSIVFCVASTEWKKYGKRSYPRTVDRRLERWIFTGTGWESSVIRNLEEGEHYESALDREIPGRADRRIVQLRSGMFKGEV